MDRDTAITKIKKCLALGKSSEPHEAAAALRQAQALMREHGISDLDVQLSDIDESKSKPVCNGTVPAWLATLANLVADCFGAEMFLAGQYRLTSGISQRWVIESSVVFVAPAPWAEVARYAFETLQRQCAKARMGHIGKQPKACKPLTKTARGDAFAVGWVAGVRGLVERLAGSERQQALLESYMAAKHPALGKAKISRHHVEGNVKDSSYGEGAEAGRRAQLHAGIAGSAEQRRLT